MPTTEEVTLHKLSYPVAVSGHGKQPMFIIGIGTLLDRTLSEQLRDKFTIYSSGLYWIGNDIIQDVSMDALATDVQSACQQLGLERPIIVAHSAYGPLALHVAKLFPDKVGGIVMLGSPPGWSDELVRKNQQHFDSHADARRKEIDTAQRARYTSAALEAMGPYERFLTVYADLDRARYWYDANYDARWLWDGLTANMTPLDVYFATTLPNYNIEENMENVKCPVFLAAGDYDYDCCPAIRWRDLKQKPVDFVIEEFRASGHYPHFEEAQLFDEKLCHWAEEKNFLKSKSGCA